MSINRRHFLVNAGLTVAAATLTASGQNSLQRSFAPEKPDANNLNNSWTAVREQFDLLSRDDIHLSSFFLVSHPRAVRAAIERHRCAIDDNPLLYIEKQIFEMTPQITGAIADYTGGKPEEVAITNSTTMGLAFVYQGLPLKNGQEILTTTHDHFVHHEAIRLSAMRAGASVKKIALFDSFDQISADEIVSRIKKAVTPKTRVVGVTWVHSGSGLKLPIRLIANAIAEINKARGESDRVLLVVDGVHGFGAEDETVAELGADFFIAGTHKWIFGPRGTGIIWAKLENWKLLQMIMPAFAPETFAAWVAGTNPEGMQAAWISSGGFRAFEYEWALPAAFLLHKQIGRARIAKRIHALNDQCKEGLAAMPHIKLYTPRGNSLSSGLICFDVKGMKPQTVIEKLLAKRVLASTTPYGVTCARIAPSLLNSPGEIEKTLRYIRGLS